MNLTILLTLLIGVIQPTQPPHIEPEDRLVVGTFGAEASWTDLSFTEISEDFSFVPSAASRAAFRAPEIELCPSDASAISSANGVRSTSVKEMVYFPLDYGTFSKTSNYGWRIHPIFGDYRLHSGTDYQASSGTSIYSIADGVVVESAYNSGAGNHVKIKHSLSDGTVWYSDYFHQLDLSSFVGQEVLAGDWIGMVGSTGNSTGPHLHLEILDNNGKTVNPDEWLAFREASFLGSDC